MKLVIKGTVAVLYDIKGKPILKIAVETNALDAEILDSAQIGEIQISPLGPPCKETHNEELDFTQVAPGVLVQRDVQ